MIFALSSEKTPKVNGIKIGVAECPYLKEVDTEFQAFSVESGIPAMPLSMDEIMLGAKNRAKNLRPLIDADYYVGIEGGATRNGERAYLGGCVYLENKDGEGHYGFSPFLEIPGFIGKKIYDEGVELGPLMQELMLGHNVRNNEGSMGVWSARTDEFSVAFKAAIAPFYNAFYKD